MSLLRKTEFITNIEKNNQLLISDSELQISVEMLQILVEVVAETGMWYRITQQRFVTLNPILVQM